MIIAVIVELFIMTKITASCFRRVGIIAINRTYVESRNFGTRVTPLLILTYNTTHNLHITPIIPPRHPVTTIIPNSHVTPIIGVV